MNNSVVEHPRTLYASQFYGRFNPIYQKMPYGITNNVATRKKYKLPITSREFGKEIILTNNLTVFNNNEIIKTKRTFDLKNLNIHKEKVIHHNQLKNFERNLIVNQKKSIKYPKDSIKKQNESNKENNGDLMNINKNNSKDIMIDDENENEITIHNDDEEDIEMKNETENKNIIYNMYPQNADEYFDDIVNELKNNEEKFLPEFNYMAKQKDINHRMRAILIDWLIDVHLKYKLVPQTMYIAVNLIDRYLSKNDTNRAKLQLVGVAAMFIACKYEEIYPPELKDFVYITDGAYVKADVLNMEYKMLKCLDFNITFPTQWSIFEIYRKKLDLNEKTFKLAWFLMELCLINYKALRFKMSVLAASAILIASKTLGVYRNNWLYKNIGVEEKQLEECCKEMYDFYVYNSTHNLQAIRRKFSLPRFDEVAKIKLC